MKILMRSGMLPHDDISFFEMTKNKSLGGNVGNLVYAYSLYRNLLVDDNTEIVPTYYKFDYTDSEIEKLNSEYDAFIIPLADAIRPNFVSELKGLTNMVKKLDIPCFIIGMGVRIDYYYEENFHYDFDDVVKDFIDSVLEKSKMIGVRGHITGDYLKRLGYVEEKDFTVIGCPSMYTFGDELNIKDVKINKNSKVSFSLSLNAVNDVVSFIINNTKKFKDSYYIPQDVGDLKVMYMGTKRRNIQEGSNYPNDLNSYITNFENKSYFFRNFPSWLEKMKGFDFSFSTRLHGTIVNILAGNPSLLVCNDGRERELAEYHQIPNIPYDKIKEDMDIFDVIKNIDFHSPEKVQKRNFNHYIEFLEINGIKHAYTKKTKAKKKFDEEYIRVSKFNYLEPVTNASKEEIAKRLTEYSDYVFEKDTEKNERIKSLVSENKNLRDKINKIELENKKVKIMNQKLNKENRKLNYRSVKITLKLRGIIVKIIHKFKKKSS